MKKNCSEECGKKKDEEERRQGVKPLEFVGV
jgi:hypothetical protein